MRRPRPAPESTLSRAIAPAGRGQVIRLPKRPSWPKSGSPLRGVTYRRVSKGEQNPENQRADVERIARARGLELVGEYVETVSAAARRPRFTDMMSAARDGHFDVLVVWALDRLGRSMVKNINAVVELDRLGVQVISVREPWLDTGGPVRELLVAIFSWMAEQERTRLGERTRAGLERARAQGKRLGRPRRHIAAAELARVKTLRARGISVREVARQLNIAPTTLRRALKEEANGKKN